MDDYEAYFKHMEYAEELAYENGFCPFTRKPCMGSDCQCGVSEDAIFFGCGLMREN